MKNLIKTNLFFILFIVFYAISANAQNVDEKNNSVLTKEKQTKLTSNEIIFQLQEGNKHFRTNALTPRNYPMQIKNSSKGQYPKAFILSCIDSRIPVEEVFDQGIGDLFVGRIAGNIVNEDILGSMEFACKVAGAKLILVMGHQHCGAIKGAIDKVNLGNLDGLLEKVNPAISNSQNYSSEKNTKNEDYVTTVCINNIKNSIKTIREKSTILKQMETNEEIKIIGGYYSLDTGEFIVIE